MLRKKASSNILKDGREQTKKAAFPQKSSLFLIRNIHLMAQTYNQPTENIQSDAPNLFQKAKKRISPRSPLLFHPRPRQRGVSPTKTHRAFCQAFKKGETTIYQSLSPYAKSPASPRPGTIYERSFNSGSIAAHHNVTSSSGKRR